MEEQTEKRALSTCLIKKKKTYWSRFSLIRNEARFGFKFNRFTLLDYRVEKMGFFLESRPGAANLLLENLAKSECFAR